MNATAITPEAIAQRWIAAFNAHDLNTLLALYHEDALHFSPKLKLRQPDTNGFVRGKAAMRNWWTDALERLPGLHYRLDKLTANDRRAFMEYTRQVGTEPDMTIAEVLEIRDGLIIASRVYHGDEQASALKEPSRH